MKKVLLGLSIIAIVAIFFFTNNNTPISDQSEEEGTSGAFQALQFNAARQAYPKQDLPSKAYTQAWEKLQDQASASTRNGDDPPPYESMGPHNRGGRTLAMAFNPENPNTLYAGSASGGLWRSHSAGQGVNAWERLELGIPVLGVSTIAFAPDDTSTMYIGTGEVYNVSAAGTGAAFRSTRGSWGMGILKTTDGGATWTKSLDWTYNQERGIWAIKVAPDNPNLIYAATTDGVYKSTDAGTTWTQVLEVVMATDLLLRPSDPDEVVVTCGNFGTPGFGIYKTVDGGNSWNKIENGLPTDYLGKGQLALAPSDEEIIYASIGNGFGFDDGASWLCRSTDFGSTWEIRTQTDYSQWQGWFAHDVAVSPANPNKLVIIGIEVWVSEDGGLNIIQESEGGVGFSNPPIEGPDGNENYVHSDAHDVVFHPTDPNIVYVASDGGMHRSEDGGLTWHSTNGAYQTAQFYNGVSSSLADEMIYTGGLQDNGTILWNGDQTWRRTFGGDGSWTATHPEDSDILFNSYQNLNLRVSFNGGDNFNFVDMGDARIPPTSFIAPYVISPSNSNVLYAGSSIVGKSIDTGDSWLPMNGGNPLDGNPILSMEIANENEDVLYVATAPYDGNRSHVFVTIDGDNFEDITQDLPDRYPMDLTVDPSDEATAYITFSGFDTGHVFKTKDYGASWEDISEGLPDIPTNAVVVDPMFPDNIYVGNDFGVFLSTDGGTNWAPFQEGMPEVAMVFDLKIAPVSRKLRVATHGNGAFQRDLADGDISSNQNIVQDFNVQISPNPTDGFFQLQFENPKTQQLHIELINSLGQPIQVFKSETFSSGTQQLELQASDVPGGTYFLRIANQEAQLVKPLIIN